MNKLPIFDILRDSWRYMLDSIEVAGFFSLINFLFFVIGFGFIGGFEKTLFIVWVIGYYCFWVMFFRYYFRVKPYWQTKRMFASLIPSTKVLVLLFLFLVALKFWPLIPMLFPMSPEFGDKYAKFLQDYMEDSKVVDLISMFILVLASPIILFRPFMAWISSIVGFSRSIKRAWDKTTDNYWRMFLLLVIVNLPFVLIDIFESYFNMNDYAVWVIISPMIVYCNVVMAKSYEFFFGCRIGECLAVDV